MEITPYMKRRLEVVGRALSDTNAEIQFTREGANTDFETVFLPDRPGWATNETERWIEITHLRNHEYAHLRYTCRKEWRRHIRWAKRVEREKRYPSGKVLCDLLNIVEDARIERAWVSEYPGCAKTMAYSNRRFASTFVYEGLGGLMRAICTIALVGDIPSDARNNLTRQENTLLEACLPSIEKGRLAPDTKGARKAVTEIADIIKDYVSDHVSAPPPFEPSDYIEGVDTPGEAPEGDACIRVKTVSVIDGSGEDREEITEGKPVSMDDASEEPESGESTDAEPAEDKTGTSDTESAEDKTGTSETEDTTDTSETEDDKKPASIEASDSGLSGETGDDTASGTSDDSAEGSPAKDAGKTGKPKDSGKSDLWNDFDDMVDTAVEDAASELRELKEKENAQTDEELEKRRAEAEKRFLENEKMKKEFDIPLHKNVTLREYDYKTGPFAARAEEEYSRVIEPNLPSLKSLAHALERQIREIVVCRQGAHDRFKRRGRLDPSGLYRLKIGETDVFRQKTRDATPDMKFHLLVDMSGSMRFPKSMHCTNAVHITSSALTACGLPHAITGFTSSLSDYGHVQHVKIKEYNTPIVEKYYAYPLANNRDGYSIRRVGLSLAAEPERVKCLIVLSDGLPRDLYYGPPESINDTRDSVREIQRRGVIVIGVLFGACAGCETHKEMYPNSVSCKSEDLPRMLGQVLKTVVRDVR